MTHRYTLLIEPDNLTEQSLLVTGEIATEGVNFWVAGISDMQFPFHKLPTYIQERQSTITIHTKNITLISLRELQR